MATSSRCDAAKFALWGLLIAACIASYFVPIADYVYGPPPSSSSAPPARFGLSVQPSVLCQTPWDQLKSCTANAGIGAGEASCAKESREVDACVAKWKALIPGALDACEGQLGKYGTCRWEAGLHEAQLQLPPARDPTVCGTEAGALQSCILQHAPTKTK